MDRHVELLRDLFLNHPAWLAAARFIKDGCTSRVRFSHIPGVFHLLRKDGQSLLRQGHAADPDLAFRFTPRSIERLSAVQGTDLGDFGIELWDCASSDDPEVLVRVRVLVGFTKLLRRGYVGLMIKGGPRVLRHGGMNVSLGDVRKLFAEMRADDGSWDQD
jgi:hypothetical protein